MIEDFVQKMIASTNGVHYLDRINRLESYPRYSLPIKKAKAKEIMLDIGCGWGRWLAAGADKDYIPVGLDLRPQFAETSLKVLKAQNIVGYTVVGDLAHMPFKESTFNFIWSFSVIQHTHRKKMTSCLSHINRMLADNGYTLLEFPNKHGIRNRFGTAQKWEKFKDAENGEEYKYMCVRYYTPKEYREFFTHEFGNFSFTNHSFIGIGVLKEDLKYVSLKNKVLCSISLAGSALTKVVPGLKYLSDSIYIEAHSNIAKPSQPDHVKDFVNNHLNLPGDNLNVVPLLHCPKSGLPVKLSEDRQMVIVPKAGLYYPVKNDIPNMLITEARSL